MTEERSRRKIYQGCMVLDKIGKTVAAIVETKKNHPIYSRRMKYSKKYRAHDESNTAKVGDIVKVMEARPLSATKRFRLLEVTEGAVIT